MRAVTTVASPTHHAAPAALCCPASLTSSPRPSGQLGHRPQLLCVGSPVRAEKMQQSSHRTCPGTFRGLWGEGCIFMSLTARVLFVNLGLLQKRTIFLLFARVKVKMLSSTVLEKSGTRHASPDLDHASWPFFHGPAVGLTPGGGHLPEGRGCWESPGCWRVGECSGQVG